MKRPKRALFSSTIVLVALALGLVAKFERYRPTERFNAAQFEQRLTQSMAASGWQREDRATAKNREAYETFAFRHPGCGVTFSVIVLGHTTGLVPLIRLEHGEDMVLLQGGRIVDRPSARHLQFEKLINAVLARFNPAAKDVAPIIALIPSPRTVGKLCNNVALPNFSVEIY